jgi:hypothetical protein
MAMNLGWPAMKNITITLDEETAVWLRLHAAQHGVSVSRFVGTVLQERMQDTRTYNDAMRGFLAHTPFDFRFTGNRRPTRDELHDRGDLR